MIFLKLKDHSMIEMRHLKNVVIFIQTILSFVLSRQIYQYHESFFFAYSWSQDLSILEDIWVIFFPTKRIFCVINPIFYFYLN